MTKPELRKFFKARLGEDYQEHAAVMEDILKRIFVYGTPYKGISLKEILEQRFNPAWFDEIDKSIASFRVQREIKAKIEDAIPHYLDRTMQKSAIDFATYLQVNKMPLKWDAWNTWKAHSKSKVLCWVTLNRFNWVISPCLTNINEYEKSIINEGLQHFVWDNFKRCEPWCPGKCGDGKSVTILGKTFNNICREIYHVNNKKVDFANPDETAINRIKKLLELERATREKKN